MFPVNVNALLLFCTTLALLLQITTTSAESNELPAFVHSTAYGNLTFTASGVRDNGDLYFHIEAPADNSWVGFGVGEVMKGSLMWVVYRSQDGKGITMCTRTVRDSDDGHVEPTHDTSVKCGLNTRDGITNGIYSPSKDNQTFVVNGYCKNVNNHSFTRRQPHSFDNPPPSVPISFDNPAQRFIFALGPTDRKLRSDKKGATIRRHSMYGQFTLDLKKASVDMEIKLPQKELAAVGARENRDANMVGEFQKDSEWTGTIHAILMCGAFVVLFPLGVIFLRMLDKVIWHAWMQGVGVVFILAGVGTGVWAGLEYNHSRYIRSPHQIIGLAAIGLTVLQFGLGLTHHSLFVRHHRPTIFARIHVFLGPVVLVLGAANGFLGFSFAGGTYQNIVYGVIVGIVFAVLIVIFVIVGRMRERSGRREEERKLQDEAFEEYKHRDVEGAAKIGRDDDDNDVGEQMLLRDLDPLDEAPFVDHDLGPQQPQHQV